MVHRTAPNYFKEQVKTQGFDIQTKTTKELIQFFETRCEPIYCERLAKQIHKEQKKNDKIPCKKKNKRAQKWCMHCKNGTHNTAKCGYLIRKQAAEQKEAHQASKKNFFKQKKMTKEEIKDFHAFQKLYSKWQAHKTYKGKNNNHNMEIETRQDDDDDVSIDVTNIDNNDDIDKITSVVDDLSL